MPHIEYKINPTVSIEELESLYRNAWNSNETPKFDKVLDKSFRYICAYDNEKLVGFINIISDGDSHAVLLDTTVLPLVQRRGIGTALVNQAREFCIKEGMEWIHVDYEPHLEKFYKGCGFKDSKAGVMKIK